MLIREIDWALQDTNELPNIIMNKCLHGNAFYPLWISLKHFLKFCRDLWSTAKTIQTRGHI